MRRPELSRESRHRIETEAARAENELQLELRNYWRRLLSERTDWVTSKASNLTPVFSAYGLRLFEAEANEYLRAMSAEEYIRFLKLTVVSKVLRQLLPPARTSLSEAKVNIIGLSEMFGHFVGRLGGRIDQSKIMVEGAARGLWEKSIMLTWSLFDRDAADQCVASQAKLLINHPFQYALRDQGNQKQFSERIRALLTARLPQWKARAFAEAPATSLPAKRKRGRPIKISDSLKRRALEMKDATNKTRAQILYETGYPSLQQVKNVPSILRHFKRKSNVKEG